MNMDLEKMEGMSASVLILHAMGGPLQHLLGRTTFVTLVCNVPMGWYHFSVLPFSGMELDVALTVLAVHLIALHGFTKSCLLPSVTP